MSFVVYTKNANGSTYAYQVTNYRDPTTKTTRQKRVYLGRVDEETKQIIPKRERKSSVVNTPDTDTVYQTENENLHIEQVNQLNTTLEILQKQKEMLIEAFDQISNAASKISTELSTLSFT